MLVRIKTVKNVTIEMTEVQASLLRGYFTAIPLKTHRFMINDMDEEFHAPMNETVSDFRNALDDVAEKLCHTL